MNRNPQTLRYSPLPIEAYKDASGRYGPANLRLLNNPAAWNLAFLSHPYESQPYHPDPNFSVHVNNTMMFDVRRGKLADGMSKPQDLFGNVMTMPAPWAVRWIKRNRGVTTHLPLFVAYRFEWLATIEKRSYLCGTHPDNVDEPINDLGAAQAVLAKITAL